MVIRRRSAPAPILLVLTSILSVQFGGALAATLIPAVGASGTVTLRLTFASAVMLLVARPRLRGHSTADWATVLAFGASLALMNSAFYASLARLPIGVAVTVEFLGPLLLSAALSRRARDFAAVLAAAVGVLLISEVATTDWADVDLVGVGLAALAGAGWAAYILLSVRTGRRFPAVQGLALAMVVATALVAPFGVATAGGRMLVPHVVVVGAGVAVLSSVLPYSLELTALRHLDPKVFGILLSLEPAVAALAGFVVLDQSLHPVQLAGMALVVAASAALSRQKAEPAQPGPVGDARAG